MWEVIKYALAFYAITNLFYWAFLERKGGNMRRKSTFLIHVFLVAFIVFVFWTIISFYRNEVIWKKQFTYHSLVIKQISELQQAHQQFRGDFQQLRKDFENRPMWFRTE